MRCGYNSFGIFPPYLCIFLFFCDICRELKRFGKISQIITNVAGHKVIFGPEQSKHEQMDCLVLSIRISLLKRVNQNAICLIELNTKQASISYTRT